MKYVYISTVEHIHIMSRIGKEGKIVRKVFCFAAVITLLFALSQTQITSAQESKEIQVDSLEQIRQLKMPVYAGQQIVFRIAKCSGSQSICSVKIHADGPTGKTGIVPLTGSATLECGATYNNSLGQYIGYLDFKQPTTFYNQYGSAPFSWNSLGTITYTSVQPWSWNSVYQLITPAIGVQSGVGYSLVNGNLGNIVFGYNHQVEILFSNGPWSCIGY